MKLDTTLTLNYSKIRIEVVIPAIERFLSKINVDKSGCWIWTASLDHGGYGLFKFNKKMIRTHRFIYEYYYGQICPDLTIDHLCRNRSCVNPLHLEQVTQQVNISRGNTGKHNNHHNKFKTRCPQGHPYSEENTYRFKNSRKCKTCDSNRYYTKSFFTREIY